MQWGFRFVEFIPKHFSLLIFFTSPRQFAPFQRNFHPNHRCLEDNTERSESFRNLATDQDRVTFVWRTIPSDARVTRDEVSGLYVHQVKLSGRQYHPISNL